MLTYKGYTARVEIDQEANIFHGEVIGTKDVITFQGTSVEEVKRAFEESIDDYLAFCKERGENPDKPFTGKFMVRVSPELHRKICFAARRSGESMNAWLNEKLEMVVKAEAEYGRQ